MTAGTVCVSVAAGKPTTNWLTWRCRADCSKTCGRWKNDEVRARVKFCSVTWHCQLG